MNNNTIKEIFSPSDAVVYSVIDILKKPQKELFEMRRKLRPKVGELTMLCSTCFQPVILAGRQDQTFYFRHIKDSDDCPIKTTSKLSIDEINAMKYNGQKEGRRHKENKLKIAELLNNDENFKDVVVEKTFREENITGIAKEWRRPDVSATQIHLGVRVAFELQVSTTFIDVIVAREVFYKNNGAFILWIFLNFEATKFTELDIFYANKSNAFVFDDEAKAASVVADSLVLKCYYHEFYVTESPNDVIVSIREMHKLVYLHELTYNSNTGKLYYFDSELSERNTQIEAKLLLEEKRTGERLALEKIAREKAEEQSGRNGINVSKNDSYRPLKPRKGLSERNYQILSKTKSFNNLRCENCGNTENFHDRACFIYCDYCKMDVKY